VPLWTLFGRVKRTGFEDEELLSVYRDHGVVVKSSRSDNNNNASEDLSTYQLVEPGDLAINKMKAWQGSVAVSDHRGIVSPAYFIFRGQHSQRGRYLHYLMRSTPYVAAYARVSKGVRPNQWDLDPQQHSRLPVLLPPIDEQQQIADYLDAQTAKIDVLIEKQGRLIETLGERRQAVISRAVTKGLDATVPMKASNVDWLGQVPTCWSILPIRYVATVGGGFTFASEDFLLKGAIPVVKQGDLFQSQFTTFTNRSVPPQFMVCSGDVLVAMSGDFKSVLWSRGRAALNQRSAFLRAKSRLVSPAWLAYSLPFVLERLERLNASTTIKNLSSVELLTACIAVPSLELQELIVRYLDRETAQIDALSAKAREMIAVLKERRQALISAAVTGKIDVRGLS
jgi:type I restriction enzyme S subunit